MNKKLLFILLFLAVILIPIGAYFALQPDPATLNTQGAVILPIENDEDEGESVVEYTHPSGDYSFNYPDTWEFLPERPELGMRPKAYCCAEFNEIVTVLYFDLGDQDFIELASQYDGVLKEDWVSLTTSNGTEGITYTHESTKLKYVTNWFLNDSHALKMMFRFNDVYANDGNTDNSEYVNDFETMLNSLTFN